MSRNPYKAYQQTQVTTAKPEKILLMLYEGAIKFNKISKAKMLEVARLKAEIENSTRVVKIATTEEREHLAKAVAAKGTHISKTMAIISELMNTLDHEVGGQLAMDLENLYMFMMDKLIEANVHNRPECLDVVEKLLITLYQAWDDVVNNPRPDGVPSPKLQPELFDVFSKVQKSAAK
jgi:flagellar secretion chaperone FliS